MCQDSRFFQKSCSETVIPAEAGIQRSGVNSVRLDSGFRRNDEKTKHVDGLVTLGIEKTASLDTFVHFVTIHSYSGRRF